MRMRMMMPVHSAWPTESPRNRHAEAMANDNGDARKMAA